RRVVRLPEDFQQLVIADALGVIDHEHRLVVPGKPRANFLVGRVRRKAPGITDRGHMHARDLPELPLCAPEAAEPEQRLLRALGVWAFKSGAVSRNESLRWELVRCGQGEPDPGRALRGACASA